MKKILHFIGILSIIISAGCTQLGFKTYMDGYIVSFQKDTLYGEVKPGNYRLKVKYPHSNRVQQYKYDRVMSYKHGEDIEVKVGKYFYKWIIKDHVCLYTRVVYGRTGSSGYGGPYSFENTYYAVKRIGEEEPTILHITGKFGKGKKYFIETASEYFSGSEKIVEGINNEKYTTKNIKQLVEDYNSWYYSKE